MLLQKGMGARLLEGTRSLETIRYLGFCRGGGHRLRCQIYALLVNPLTIYHDYGIHAQAGELHNYEACYRHVESLHWEIKENSSRVPILIFY